MMMLDQTRWYYVALMCGHTLITAGAALLIPAFEQVAYSRMECTRSSICGDCAGQLFGVSVPYHDRNMASASVWFGHVVAHAGIISGSISIVDIWCSVDELPVGGSTTVALA